MTSLSKALREKLDQRFTIPSLRTLEVLRSKIDGTEKYLFALEDGNVIESVLMRYSYGISVCISSQVGCRMGCRFCASTIGGRVRDLTASEMLGQVIEISRQAGERVSHVVIMGSGEPLDNYDNLVRFLRIMGDPDGERLSLRDITVSTCGIVPNIYALADEGLPVTLALSLHAPTQEKRERLLPVSRRYRLPEVMDAMRYYFDKTGRRITFEYSCVEGENTSSEDAVLLADLVRGMNCHINLIPVNPVEERSFRRPDRRDIEAFRGMLEKRGISVTIRREMGRDINGACGQLRRSYLEK
jgi:23S rRNA (adenine2503-C2)-methyltransferase